MASIKTLRALAAPKHNVKRPEIIGSEAQRARKNDSRKQRKIADLTFKKGESESFLSQGRHEEAVPGALEALDLSKELYGAESINIVPCYLLLAEANLGMQQLGQAEWYLSQANWSVLKAPKEECSNHTRSIVHRCFGKLYALQGRTEEALTHLASNVYYCARETGSTSVDCADGYFLLAQVMYMAEGEDGFWLKDEKSGKYVKPLLTGDTEMGLTLEEGGYGNAAFKFTIDYEGCMRHEASGKYVQPTSSRRVPHDGTELVLRDGRELQYDGDGSTALHSFAVGADNTLRHASSDKLVQVTGSAKKAEAGDPEQLILREAKPSNAKFSVVKWGPDKKESALAFFVKVLDVWFDVLCGPDGVDAAMAGTATMNDVVVDEGRRMLQRVLDVLIESSATAEGGAGPEPEPEGAAAGGWDDDKVMLRRQQTAQAQLTTGLMYHYMGSMKNAVDCYTEAQGALGAFPVEQRSSAVHGLLDMLGNRLAQCTLRDD